MSDTVGSSGVAKAADFPDARQRGRSLVLAAFDDARSSGRQEWYLMTTAVLKNRLLNSTDRAFNERDYGVSSIVDFARLFPEDLEVDARSAPPVVRLTRLETLPAPTIEGSGSTDRPAPYKRIRPDLWRAAVDYRSGATYVWDEIAHLARVANIDDTSPALPTATATEMAGWRHDFAESVRSELNSDRAIERLDEWLRNSYGTAFLPTELRGRWSEFSREKVEVLLRDFFEGQRLAPPDDLIDASGEQSARASRSVQSDRPTNAPRLRDLVQRCVAVMTEKELTELRISPAVMLRATGGRL
ncbi:MAG: hypothetical protein ABIZ05_03315 [Pseudonocardiaceae bacterium]